jgi:hypothetical protein
VLQPVVELVAATEIAPTVAPRSQVPPRVVGLAAAALLTVGGAIGGAWAYSRWQQQRTTRARVKRKFTK